MYNCFSVLVSEFCCLCFNGSISMIFPPGYRSYFLASLHALYLFLLSYYSRIINPLVERVQVSGFQCIHKVLQPSPKYNSKTFVSPPPQKKNLIPISNHSPFYLPSASYKHWSSFCFSGFSCLGCLVQMEAYNMCSFVLDFFQLVCF